MKQISLEDIKEIIESEKIQLEEFEKIGNYKKTQGIIYEHKGIKSLAVLCPYCTEMHIHGYIEGQCEQHVTFRESHCGQGTYSIELTDFDDNKGMYKYPKVKCLTGYFEKHHKKYKSELMKK